MSTIIRAMGCAGSGAAALTIGCASIMWTSGMTGHHCAFPIELPHWGMLPELACSGCGAKPDGELRMREHLATWLHEVDVSNTPLGQWRSTSCCIIVSEES